MKINVRFTLALAALAVLLIAAVAYAAYTPKIVYQRFSCTAGETLAAGNVVAVKAADGKCYKADANDSALRPAIGIIGMGGASAASVEVITSGIISGWTITAGSPGYLSETAGAITQTAPAYSQQLGVAINTTTYYFSPQRYIDSASISTLDALTVTNALAAGSISTSTTVSANGGLKTAGTVTGAAGSFTTPLGPTSGGTGTSSDIFSIGTSTTANCGAGSIYAITTINGWVSSVTCTP